MNEITDLKQLKSALFKTFSRITDRAEFYLNDEAKYAKLVSIQHKIGKALIDCEAVERNLNLKSDENTVNKDIVSFIQRVQRESEEKRALQTFKTWLETSDEVESVS